MILLLPLFNGVLTITTEGLAGALCNLSFVKDLEAQLDYQDLIIEQNLDSDKIVDFINKNYQFETKDGEKYYYELEHNSRHFHVNGYEKQFFITENDLELTISEELEDCIIPNFSIESPQTALLTMMLVSLFSKNEDDADFFEDCMDAKSCLLRSYDTNSEIAVELPEGISNLEEFFNSNFKKVEEK